MIDYAYTDQCLRRYILEYFGERIVGAIVITAPIASMKTKVARPEALPE